MNLSRIALDHARDQSRSIRIPHARVYFLAIQPCHAEQAVRQAAQSRRLAFDDAGHFLLFRSESLRLFEPAHNRQHRGQRRFELVPQGIEHRRAKHLRLSCGNLEGGVAECPSLFEGCRSEN